MESTNIPQEFHQEQELQQPVESASSSSLHASTPHGNWYNGASRYGSSQFSWSPNNNPFINNVGNRIHQLYNTSRPPYTGENDHEDEEIHIPSWSKNTEYEHHQHQTLIPIPDQTSNKSKLDLFNSFMFPKFTDMISSSHSSIEDLQHLSPTSYLKTENHFQDSKLLRTNPALLSPSGQPDQFPADVQFLSNLHDYSGYEGSSTTSLPLLPSRGTFSQIFPSVNISNLNHTHLNSAVSSSPLEMNVQALDLLTSARFGDGVSHDQTQQSHVVGQQHLQLYAQRPTSSPDKLPSNVHGGSATYTKRPQTEPRTTKTSSKKSRTDQSRACPPFKVRKEKLGDRIAALQQLVAPFGKTDTASVLMEAIGYIKFLQNQVETLSVPYMKSSRTRCVKSSQTMGRADHGNLDQSRRDLRSRGLCLVPLSCMSYVTNDDGGGWPSSDYHGGEPN